MGKHRTIPTHQNGVKVLSLISAGFHLLWMHKATRETTVFERKGKGIAIEAKQDYKADDYPKRARIKTQPTLTLN